MFALLDELGKPLPILSYLFTPRRDLVDDAALMDPLEVQVGLALELDAVLVIDIFSMGLG